MGAGVSAVVEVLLRHILLGVTLRRAQTLAVIERVPVVSASEPLILLRRMVIGLHVMLQLWVELRLELLLLLLGRILHHHVLPLRVLALTMELDLYMCATKIQK